MQNISFVEKNIVKISVKYQSHCFYCFWGEDFFFFIFFVAMATNQIQQLEQNSYVW